MTGIGLELLRSQGLRLHDEVWTADDRYLGDVLSLHHRPREEVDAGLKLYATYLEVHQPDMGNSAYIPSDFVATYNSQAGRLKLSVTMKRIAQETWMRMPDFVAGRRGVREEL